MARGGFPGGFGGINMNQIMKQAKKMQEEMEKSQENLASQTFESTTGGGAVYAKVNGSKELMTDDTNPFVPLGNKVMKLKLS